MPKRSSSKANRPHFPPGADRALLQRQLRASMTDREKRFQEEHRQFLARAKARERALGGVAPLLNADRKEAEKRFAAQRLTTRNLLRKQKPTPFTPLRGHNPVRSAPFDFQWSSVNCGGITSCSQYGPDAGSGEVGSDLGIFNAGGASAASAVGYWFWSQTDTFAVTIMQASVWGRGYVFSGLFGYASAYAGLRAFVREHSDTAPTYSAQTTIYDDSGVIEFDITEYDWQNFAVVLFFPMRRNTWYEIWTEVVQSAYAGGIADSVSNFDAYAGPVTLLAP